MSSSPTSLPRVGVLGGTFDPPHAGHLALAQAARETLGLEEVIFLPAAKNPLKARQAAVEGHHRLSMLRVLLNGKDGFAVSDMELTRGGASYTVDTLGELHMVRPAEYWFIVGADSLRNMEEWRNLPRLARLCRLAVAGRPPLREEELRLRVPEAFRDKYDLVHMKPMEVSSSDLRDRLVRKRTTADLLDPAVLRYIQQHRLYST